MLYLGSSCIYPRNAKQPIIEDDLLTGRLEETNEPYAIAKIALYKYIEILSIELEKDKIDEEKLSLLDILYPAKIIEVTPKK